MGCTCSVHNAKRKQAPNPLRMDPTRTATLRRVFETVLVGRFERLRRKVLTLIGDENALGLTLNYNPGQPRDHRGRWSSGGSGSPVSALSKMGVEVVGEASSEYLEIIAAEVERLQSSYTGLANIPVVKLRLVPGTSFKMDVTAGKDVDLYGSYAPKTLLRSGVTTDAEITLVDSLGTGLSQDAPVGSTLQSAFSHEYGHHVLAVHTRPKENESDSRSMSWQNASRPYVGRVTETTVSDYARLDYREMFAEAFAIYTAPNYSRGRLPQPIEHYLDKALRPTTTTVNTRRFVFRTRPEQVQAFLQWLTEQINADILLGARATEQAYWERYVQEGYEKGAGRAFDDARVAKRAVAEGQRSGSEQLAYYQGTREEFLRSSFGRPESVEKVKLLAGRVFTDLKGVTDAMSSSMARVLTDGLVQGQNPKTIAKTLADEVEGIGKYRARLIARTEIIRAHAEGQLDALEAMGMDEVGVQVEWSSSPDSRRCRACEKMEGKVYTIEEAHGLIPLHPQCRCSFIPANVGEVQAKPVKRPKSKV